MLAHDRRRILHFNVRAHPTAEWTAQQLRDAFPWDTMPRYLLRDRDRKRQPAADARWDQRIPLPGTVLTRHFQGRIIEVRVLQRGFEYDRRWFRSLSGIAEQITGTRWNGFVFFGLKRRQRPHAA